MSRPSFRQPTAQPARRLSALAASVSVMALLGAQPASAQVAGTLPGAAVLQGGRWTGARLPTVAQGNNGLVMTITQEQKRALLDWSKFNVAKGEEVLFEQGGTDWIALNRIFDQKPSEIAGKITAKGQVWLQNTNGIIFRDGAQVNAHSIVATALPITEEQLNKGLLSGLGVIRGTTKDMLFSDLYPNPNLAMVPRPIDGLDPTTLLNATPAMVGGENPTIIDLMARAAIRQAVLRSRNYEGLNGEYERGYTLGLLNNYDYQVGKTTYYVDYNLSANGLAGVMESIVANIDVSQLGAYNYADYQAVGNFFNNGSSQAGTSASIPQALRDAVAAQIKAQFVDNYAAHVATARQNYNNYIANSRITVERGAILKSVSSDAASPGKIMLFGPNVSNAGRLEAPDGQVLIAAGEQVKLNAGQGYTNSLRGGITANVMAVAVSDIGGSVPGLPWTPNGADLWKQTMIPRANDIGMLASNTGTITSDRGAVLMIGASVDQSGSVLVTNGVRQRTGTIVLQASHGFNMSDGSGGGNYFAGKVTLGENSVTRITPDLSTLTGLAADTFAPGKILLAGNDILLDRNAELTSRSGEVIIHANPYGSGARGGTSPAVPDDAWSENRGDAGSFTMRAGARIDVSGLRDVERNVSDNVFAVEVRANEVSASPNQRDGVLIGQTVYIDRRVGSSLVDWTGALGGEQRTAAQMSTAGGKVQIRASNSAVIDNGATIDVSGGSTKFLGGEIKTTLLQDGNKRFHDIATASANVKYTGMTTTSRTEAGYTDGANAGAVEILSGASRLFGSLKGDIVVGSRQQRAAAGLIKAPLMPAGAVSAALVKATALPVGGSAVLHLGGPEYGTWASTHLFVTADEAAFTGKIWTENSDDHSWSSVDTLLDPGKVGVKLATGEVSDQPAGTSYIEDDFFSGMASVGLSFGGSSQTQTINDGASIRLAPGGRFNMSAEGGIQTVGDNVTIVVPSGVIGFASNDGVTMGRNIKLSVAAGWVNDVDAPAGTVLGYSNGGTIDLLTAKLTAPILLDASGGGWYKRLSPATIDSPGEFALVLGKGGGISLGNNGMTLGDILSVADMRLSGLGGNGSLSILASGDVVVGIDGGTTTADREYISNSLLNGIDVGALTLGATSIEFTAGAKLLFQQRQLMFNGSPLDVRTGTDLRDVTRLELLPAHERAGASATFMADSITVAKGARIEVDPTGTLALNAAKIDVDGMLVARGGSILLGSTGSTGAGGVRLGSTAVLDASGVAQTVIVAGGNDGRGFWYAGRILAGGSISIDTGDLAIESGALLDVSGNRGMLSAMHAGRLAVFKVNEVIGSDAGSISIIAGSGYMLGTMRGDAGSRYNYAGTLAISGGANGNLLSPGETDWSTGKTGLESLLQNLAYAFYPEPTPEEPISLRDYFRNNNPGMEAQLGFGPEDIEDLQITSVAEFIDFVRVAMGAITAATPADAQAAMNLDSTLTKPLAPSGPSGMFTVPGGFTPLDRTAFDRSLQFVLQGMMYGPAAKDFHRGTTMHVGAPTLASMARFDTVELGSGGVITADHVVSVASQRVLNLNAPIEATVDMRFTGRTINLIGALPAGGTPKAASAGTLTISGETVDFRSRFNVGGFADVVIEAAADMRGGYMLDVVNADGSNTPGLITTGNLLLRAAQIYPTTDGTLSFTSASKIRIERTGSSQAPLSAGGTLAFAAPTIEQAGTLRAPFGEIKLVATRVDIVDANGLPVLGGDGVQKFTPGTITLLPGSLTSTSAGDRTILYGTTFDGQSWYAPGSRPEDAELTTPPEKRVTLTADAIDVRSGATIDVSGGGDVLGIEFVAGPLGQTNVLQGEGVYAIVPLYGAGVTVPIDPLYNPLDMTPPVGATKRGDRLNIGDAVWLKAFDGNAAGWYTLLPAEYALTPGGYRITLANAMSPVSGATRQLGDKSFAVGGVRGVLGTTIQDQVESTWRLEKGSDVRNRSEFFETSGNGFFSSERFLEGLLRSGEAFNADPRLPVDGGFLTLAANTSLKLDGTIAAAGMKGIKGARGGVVDITSDNIVIAAAGTDVSDLAGYLVLDPNKLSNIAESLLIGGIRRQGAGGLEIVVGQSTRDEGEIRSPEKSIGAENVVIRTDAANPLTGTELLFAANQEVRVEKGAVVRAIGDGTDAVNLIMAPSMPAFTHPWDPSQNLPAQDRGGALLRVSNLGDITVSRSNIVADGGDMIVEVGATLKATDAILLDATRNTVVGDGATLRAGAITAASSLVSFGNAPAGTAGLIASGATLTGLGQASKLTLKSYSTFDFYGDVALNLTGAAVFDGAAFVDRGAAPGNVSIKATSLELRNTDATPVDAVGGAGTLALAATNVTIGAGDIDFAYATTTIDAGQRLILSGQGDDRFDGILTVRAAEITGTSGASHEITAAGAVALLGDGSAAALPAFVTAGALLDFRGTSVDIGGTIRAGSGTVRATATTGDVHMASGATIDVGGSDVSFFEVQGFLPGGGVQLTAVEGDVHVDAGSTVNISGGKAGGDAGTLVLSAGRGVAVLGGTLQAKVAAGYRGGSFGLTTSTLADFGGLNALLNASGFSRSRDFAILSGDVVLNGETRVDALRLVTGSGSITVAADALIASDSAKGGSVLLASGGDLMVADGARFDMGARGLNQRGGSVDLQVAVGGDIYVGAAAINVAANGTGQAGQVRLRAAQTGNDVAVTRWGATVTGGDTQLEAFKVYDLADADGNAANGIKAEIDTALQQQVIGDAAAFMTANAANIATRLGQSGNALFAVVPGIELRSTGDMDLVHNWNLAGARFGGKPGVLTLRAGGNLTINANLSDGFVSGMPTPDVNPVTIDPQTGNYPVLPGTTPVADLTNDQSWSYNLVAGADFQQTNVLATRSDGVGDMLVGGLVRTGTGDIRVAAAGNLNYEAAALIGYQNGYSEGTRITVPMGIPIADGTVLAPTTYVTNDGLTLTRNPSLPANTVLRKGTRLPAGTLMPDGTTLAADTVLAADVTLLTETFFPGIVTIVGKTRLGSELVWHLNSQNGNRPDSPSTPALQFSIAGLGDVVIAQPINGSGFTRITLADGRMINDNSTFNFENIDPVEMVSGAIYTAGVEAAAIADYTPPSLSSVLGNAPATIRPHYTENGGDVSIVAGGAIVGAGTLLENAEWLAASGGVAKSTLYGFQYTGTDPNALFVNGQTSLSMLFDRFRQGVGALGGGDVAITSGGDVDNLTVALPTSIRVSGGLFEGSVKQVHATGGGDLAMSVGGDLLGSLVLVSKGQGIIDVAGSVRATEQPSSIYLSPQRTPNTANLTLLVDDASIALQAGGDVVLRGISSSLGVISRYRNDADNVPMLWLGYTAATAARVTSLGGDITLLGVGGNGDILPSQTAFIATAGSINFGRQGSPMPTTIVDAWPDTRLDLLAMKDINFWTGRGNSYGAGDLNIGWFDPSFVSRAVNPSATGRGIDSNANSPVSVSQFVVAPTFNSTTGAWEFIGPAGPGYGVDGDNVHEGSTSYSRIYAATGNVASRGPEYNGPRGLVYNTGWFHFGHDTRLKAGSDIRMGEINFLTHDGGDMPTIEARGAVYMPNAKLFGPGRLWVQAGGEVYMGRSAGNGIRALSAVSTVVTAIPENGGSISILAGIDQAPEYASFFDYYLDPKSVAAAPSWLRQYYVPGDRGLSTSTEVVLGDGKTAVTVYAIELVNYMRQLDGKPLIVTEVIDEKSGSRDITRGALAAKITPVEFTAALTAFKALDLALQQPLAIRILNAELRTAGREAVGFSPETDGRSARAGDPTRGYDAVGRLFPGAQRKPGEALAAGEHNWTGSINMIVSQVRADSGGDVDLIAPGGSVQLASLSVANTNPGQAGIVTQRGGNITAVVKSDYIVNQSRTMTADDGDLMIWSSFGNIDAGRGRKSSLSVPPVAFVTDAYGQMRIQLSGLPNGAGIATLDQVDGKQGGDVDLYAFNGIVNAGDAGIRASRDLFIGATEIRGLDNITVGGISNVDLTTDGGEVGPLNLQNFAQAAEDKAIDDAFSMTEEVEKLRTVRQTILTGSVVSFGTDNCTPTDGRACP